MKKILLLMLILSVLAVGCSPQDPPADEGTGENGNDIVASSNFTDEMKIEHKEDISPDDGADSVERDGDHEDSPYFKSPDYYNMESSDNLTILTNFRTQQQTSEWSCGVTSALMVMDWYDVLGDYEEITLADFRENKLTPEATTLNQLIQVFEGVGGFDLYSTFDVEDPYSVFTFDFIKEKLAEGTPIIIGWNDWGAHWQTIIGYDDMGTETTGDDIIIVADSYDTTDHNQDGYGIFGAERFIYNFTFYDYFPEEELNDMVFLIATPQD